ncbi:MAG TPA: transcriptional regulator [Eoetvoesiella sp.]
MTNKIRIKSPILAAVHETANDLHRQGLVSKRTMNRCDALCLEPIPVYNNEDIRAMREKLNFSLTVLAKVLNTSVSTIRK